MLGRWGAVHSEARGFQLLLEGGRAARRQSAYAARAQEQRTEARARTYMDAQPLGRPRGFLECGAGERSSGLGGGGEGGGTETGPVLQRVSR